MDKALRYFISVCECGSISKAADRLYISRQALSKLLSHYESDIGVHLFNRNVHGIFLTPAGQELYQKGKIILTQYDEMMESIRKHSSVSKEPLRVAFSLLALKVRIAMFQKKHPETSFRFVTMKSSDAWTSLRQKEIDLVCSIAPPLNYGLESIKIRHGTPVLLASKNSPIASKSLIYLKDLNGQNLLNSDELQSLYDECDKKEISVQSTPFTTDPLLISAAVADGMGVYATPQSTLQLFDMSQIRAIPVAEGVMDLDLVLTCLDVNLLPKSALAFADFLREIGSK